MLVEVVCPGLNRGGGVYHMYRSKGWREELYVYRNEGSGDKRQVPFIQVGGDGPESSTLNLYITNRGDVKIQWLQPLCSVASCAQHIYIIEAIYLFWMLQQFGCSSTLAAAGG